jgi:hypothetical protein
MGITVVIKDVDEGAFRMLRAEAVKKGIKVGQAASQAFRLWAQESGLKPLKDLNRLRSVVEAIENARLKLRMMRDWSSVDVIRSWRERPNAQ